MDDASVDAEGNELYVAIGVIAAGFLILIVVVIVGWLIIRDPARPECLSDTDCTAYTCDLTTNTCRTSCSKASDCDALHSCTRGGVCRLNAETTSRVTSTPITCGDYGYDLANLRCFTSCVSDRQCLGGFTCAGNRCTRRTVAPTLNVVLPGAPANPTAAASVNEATTFGQVGTALINYGGTTRVNPRTTTDLVVTRPGSRPGVVTPPVVPAVPIPPRACAPGDSACLPVIGEMADLLSLDNPAAAIFNSDAISCTFGNGDSFCGGTFGGVNDSFTAPQAGIPCNYGNGGVILPGAGIGNPSSGLGFCSEGQAYLFSQSAERCYPRPGCSVGCGEACCDAEPAPQEVEDFAAFLQ